MKKVQNELYKTTLLIGASRIKQFLWYMMNVMVLKNSFNISSLSKVFFLRLFGAKIGKGVYIKPSVNIKYPWKLTIGSHSWIGEEVWIDNLSEVVIGSNVTLSQGAMILTGSHDHTKTTFDFISMPVNIEDGCWLGAMSVVYGGVVCKTHSILGINSVAEIDLEEYTIYKGNPAIPVIKRNIN
jgi:putative colanic acid biosynthesis acetyltransferase WcaF